MGRCRFGHFPEQRNPWRQISVHVPWWWSWQRYPPNCYTRLSWSRRGQHSKLLQEPAQLCCTAPWDTNHWWSKPSSHYAILRGLWTHSARLCRRCCSSCRWNFFLVWDERHGQNEAWSRGHLQTLLVSLLFAFWLTQLSDFNVEAGSFIYAGPYEVVSLREVRISQVGSAWPMDQCTSQVEDGFQVWPGESSSRVFPADCLLF